MKLSYAAREETALVKAGSSAPLGAVTPLPVLVTQQNTVSAVKSLIAIGVKEPAPPPPKPTVTPLPGVLGDYQKNVIAGMEKINVTAGIDRAAINEALSKVGPSDAAAIVGSVFDKITPAYWQILAGMIMVNIGDYLRQEFQYRTARDLREQIASVFSTAKSNIGSLIDVSSLPLAGAVAGATVGNWLYSNVPRLGYIKSTKGNYYIKKVR